ncbi:MAG: hypothetical protein V7K89_26690 [Nostoc sp.]|uniref:hypothetical protein n=1 Tax=Nostoc sp. TaxID=1180 RepID=UPI002FF56476
MTGVNARNSNSFTFGIAAFCLLPPASCYTTISLVFQTWSLVFGTGSLLFQAWSLMFGTKSLLFQAWSLMFGTGNLLFQAWSLVFIPIL